MSLAILLGAGASIDSGMASTRAITDFLFSDNRALQNSDGSYSFGADPQRIAQAFPNDYIWKIKILLGALKTKIDLYHAPRPAHYEDIFYAVDQLASDYDGDFDNPSIRPMTRQMETEIGEIFPRGLITIPYSDAWTDEHRVSTIGLDSMPRAVHEARRYIKDAVTYLLAKTLTTDQLDPYQWIVDAIVEHPSLPIFTLNHDTLMEQVLRGRNMSFVDGFAPNGNGMSNWNPAVFDTQPNLPRLLKLHGSINWHYATASVTRRQSIISVQDYELARTQWDFGHADQRQFLAGVHNKLAAYTNPPYEDLRYQFYRTLKTATALVACGYSFGDKGVNTSIANWLENEGGRKLIIIDPNCEAMLGRSARSAISGKAQSWQERGKLRTIDRRMKELTWSVVTEALQDTSSPTAEP